MSDKTTAKFTRDFLRNSLDLPCPPGTYEAPAEGDYPSFTVHEDTITGHRRWSVDHRLIFSITSGPDANRNGEAWEVSYSRGATESQEQRAWADETEIEATLVRREERRVMVWEPVK